MANGDVVELTKDKGQVLAPVKAGVVLVDSSRAFEIDETILEERRHLAEDGMVVVALTIDHKMNVLAGPDVAMRGVILPGGVSAEDLVERVKHQVILSLKDKSIVSSLSESELKTYIKEALQGYFEDKVKSKPLLQIVLQEVAAAKAKSLAK